MTTSIYIGVDKLDLYKDDNISLKSSIAEIQDITKVFTDSTNSFSVPATDNNNRIFKHFYNSNLLNGWDVFNKVDSVIELDGVLYKQGKIKLNNVITKSQKPISYDIQFFGLLISLKDTLKDYKLSDLDFSGYDFEYTSDNVLSKLTTFNGVPLDLVATPLSTKRLIYDSDSNTENTPDVKNIAFNNTDYNSGIPWYDTSISILNLRIIEAIESSFGLAFSRDYFNANNFNNLYLLLNGNGTENTIEEQVFFDNSTDSTLENDSILLSTNLTYRETDYLRISVKCQGDNKRDSFTATIKSNGEKIHEVTANGNDDGLYVYIVKKSEYEVFENLTFHFKSSSILDYRYTVDRFESFVSFYKSERDYADLEDVFNVSENMPDIKIIDYLKGLFKKDKLIAINTSDTDVYIDSLTQFYRKGEVKDITKNIDFSEIPISIGSVYNEINYKFKEPQTLLAKQFFNNNGYYYGDLEYKILDANGNTVDGEKIDVKLPFENMVYEKLNDISGVEDINFLYGYMANDSLSPVTVKAHLHYTNHIATNVLYKVLTGSSSYSNPNGINIPSHTIGLNSPQYSTTFGEEFNEYNGIKITNTIYSNFHKTFIENAFNSNKRLYKYKCKNLPLDFLVNLKLNDVLLIKDNYYRINKYNLNLITKECDFEVYNIKNLDLTPINGVTWDTIEETWDTTEITFDNNI